MSEKSYTRYKLEALPCTHCGRPEQYVGEFIIPDEASKMMAAVRAKTGVGHQDSSLSHIDLAERFKILIRELTQHSLEYVDMLDSRGWDRWYDFGRIIDGMSDFIKEAEKLSDAKVTISVLQDP